MEDIQSLISLIAALIGFLVTLLRLLQQLGVQSKEVRDSTERVITKLVTAWDTLTTQFLGNKTGGPKQ